MFSAVFTVRRKDALGCFLVAALCPFELNTTFPFSFLEPCHSDRCICQCLHKMFASSHAGSNPDCYCSSEAQNSFPTMGWAYWERGNYCVCHAQWEGKVLITCACFGLQTIFRSPPETDWYIVLFFFMSICLCVCLTKNSKREEWDESCRSPSIWDISKAMKHRSKHDSHLYWLVEHWL